MNKAEFVQRIAATMRENNIRKPISAQKQVFHISDDEGNKSDFVIRKTDRTVMFTIDDVRNVIDACIAVIEDAMRHGEPIAIHGFGTLALHYRKARRTKHPETGEEVYIADRYVPKFSYGKDLRMCARMFELDLEKEQREPSNYLIDNGEGGENNGD